MTEPRDLLIYGQPDMQKLKAAKESMNLDFLVKPIFLTRNYESGWGLENRVLAYDAEPPFLCDYAPVGAKTSQEGLVAALKWVLLGGEDPRATKLPQLLSKWMGTEVRELTQAERDAYTKAEALKRVSFSLKLDERGDSRDR